MNNQSGSSSLTSRVLVIDSDHAELVGTSKLLAAVPQVEICAETTCFTLAVSQVGRCNPDFVFCAVGLNLESECVTIAKIREQHPMIRIVCVGDRSDSQSILKCFRSGADEFLMKPLQEEEVRQVFQRLQVRAPAPREEEEAAPTGKVLAVWGSRGGSGATTIACNLAFDLARSGPAILVDLHEHQGDLALFFDLKPTFSLQDIWGNGERIDEALVESVTITTDSGLKLLLQPPERRPGQINPDELVILMRVLQSRYPYVVLDIGHDEEMAKLLLPFLHQIYLVVNQNLPSLYLASQKIRELKALGYVTDHVRVLVNAFSKRGAVTRQHIQKALGIGNLILIREDERAVVSAINRGIPLSVLSRRGKAARDIAQLADQITGPLAAHERPASKRTLFPRLLFSHDACVEATQ